jgi:hypothetical protein
VFCDHCLKNVDRPRGTLVLGGRRQEFCSIACLAAALFERVGIVTRPAPTVPAPMSVGGMWK